MSLSGRNGSARRPQTAPNCATEVAGTASHATGIGAKSGLTLRVAPGSRTLPYSVADLFTESTITRQEIPSQCRMSGIAIGNPPLAVSYTHLRAHETRHDLVCRLLLEKKK